MPTQFSDTHPDMEKLRVKLLREMPPARRIQLLNDLIETGRMLSMAGLHARFPQAGPEELRRRLSTLILGPELARQVYGPEPDPPTLR